MINKITVQYPLSPCCDRESGNHSSVHWDVRIQLTYIKSIDMLNRNTPGVKKARPSWKHQLALNHAFN